MILGLFSLTFVGAVAWLAWPRCSHTDSDGHSLLMWATHNGRLRGYCDRCERYTTGWDVLRKEQPCQK